MADPLKEILEQIQELRSELQTGLQSTREELRTQFQSGLEANRKELYGALESMEGRIRTERREDLAEALESQRRQYEVVVEGLRDEIQAVAEGVAQNREAIETLREDSDRKHEELRSMFRLSYRGLDDRTSTLETSNSKLGERVDDHEHRIERLEAEAS